MKKTKAKTINTKTAELAMLMGMAFSVFCAGFCGFAENYRDITETVFRLHILANSDSEKDQSLKLLVRDAVLEENSAVFEGCLSAEEAAEAAEKHMDEIKSTAERVLAENCAGYGAECSVAKMRFDDRVYDNITMPAGEYLALRVTLGEAEGKNWWCVMFPPLCLPAVSGEAAEEVFSPEELELLEAHKSYECRFYFLELLEKLGEKTDA
ncbi:MAG: stage II sporulation protein R [Oscillospiraceae bacterium]|nr:stage II sporulation protein R [Oscillospiraceae bacterium]